MGRFSDNCLRPSRKHNWLLSKSREPWDSLSQWVGGKSKANFNFNCLICDFFCLRSSVYKGEKFIKEQ